MNHIHTSTSAKGINGEINRQPESGQWDEYPIFLETHIKRKAEKSWTTTGLQRRSYLDRVQENSVGIYNELDQPQVEIDCKFGRFTDNGSSHPEHTPSEMPSATPYILWPYDEMNDRASVKKQTNPVFLSPMPVATGAVMAEVKRLVHSIQVDQAIMTQSIDQIRVQTSEFQSLVKLVNGLLTDPSRGHLVLEQSDEKVGQKNNGDPQAKAALQDPGLAPLIHGIAQPVSDNTPLVTIVTCPHCAKKARSKTVQRNNVKSSSASKTVVDSIRRYYLSMPFRPFRGRRFPYPDGYAFPSAPGPRQVPSSRSPHGFDEKLNMISAMIRPSPFLPTFEKREDS